MGLADEIERQKGDLTKDVELAEQLKNADELVERAFNLPVVLAVVILRGIEEMASVTAGPIAARLLGSARKALAQKLGPTAERSKSS